MSVGDFNAYMKLSGQHQEQHQDAEEQKLKIKAMLAPE